MGENKKEFSVHYQTNKQKKEITAETVYKLHFVGNPTWK